MLKAIIIDDEPYCCEILAALLEAECPEVDISAICSRGEDGVTAILQHNPDIVFLDVEMPKMNGFEMLEQLKAIKFHLIFTTSYDQYALKAIRFSALDYLLKPVDREELRKAVTKAAHRTQSPLPEQMEMLMQKISKPSHLISKIALPTVDGLQMLPIETIISCESDDNYTWFKLKGNKKILVTKSLKEIEESLEQYLFLRVHRSYLINLNEIDKYVKGEGGYVIMSDRSSIDVSKSRKEMLVQKLQHYSE